ncbi:MAG: hypothetical protein ABEJ57_07255 [Halobacteriaceae archaeon]
MTSAISWRSLFRWLFIEEYRLHARLFGGRRFGLVPLVLLGGSALAYRLLLTAEVTPASMVGGLHLLAVLLGLQVGAVALVGRDMIENLLGETTMLLASVRTLPISGRRLLAIFILKDVCYYALLYIVPAVLGLVALIGAGLTPIGVVLATATVTTAFVLGVATSVALVGLSSRHRGLAVLAIAAIALTLAAAPSLIDRYSPYAIYDTGSVTAVAATAIAIATTAAIGAVLLEFSRDRTTRTSTDQYSWLRDHVPGATPWLVAKAILDVARSAGGLAKVVVSLALVVGIVGAVLEGVTRAIGIRPAAGPAFAGLLALASFTTYNWLTTVDDADLRRSLPVELSTVFWSVLIAHLLLAVPVATALLLAAAWWFGTATLLPGVLALPGLIVYVVGVTAYVTGLHPGERLFDAGRFATFSAAAAVVAVPVLLAAFAAPVVEAPIAWFVTAGSLVAGGVGLGLIARAGPRWTAVVRTTGAD